jgi:UPF0755 protein
VNDDDLGLLGGHRDDHHRDDHHRDDHHRDDHHPGAGGSRYFDDPDRAAPARFEATARRPRRAEARRAQERRTRARRKRRTGTLVAVVVLLVLGGGVFLGGRALLGGLGIGGSTASDYSGGGLADVVVRVAAGDSTSAIAKTLVDDGVVSSVPAFTRAASGNAGISAIQPGYYKLRTQIPGSDAVSRLLASDSRVGNLVIPEGVQLDDVTGASGTVTDGILTRMQKASCVDLDGTRTCTSLDDLRSVASTGNLAALGVPTWATAEVAAATVPGKRLEGLIRPGSYDLEPGAPAQQQLTKVVTASAASFESLGLPRSTVGGLTPYQVLVTASLVQREALPADFAKVSRVVYNRLAVNQKLEFDSTVNYPLDVQAIATTAADRGTVTPWNTYASPGLPATPISAPSDDALTAAEQPADGTWLYFVTIDTRGTTVFSDTFPEHQAAIARAQANGVFG